VRRSGIKITSKSKIRKRIKSKSKIKSKRRGGRGAGRGKGVVESCRGRGYKGLCWLGT
jgi:hypothetical protein